MYTQRTVDVSRAPGGGRGSHVLSYADGAGGTETNGLFGTPDEICRGLEALRRAGVDYILFTMLGGSEQLRRFARDVMPGFGGDASASQGRNRERRRFGMRQNGGPSRPLPAPQSSETMTLRRR